MSDSAQQCDPVGQNVQERCAITKPVKHSGRVTQGHKLAAPIKKIKEELLVQSATIKGNS